MRKRLKIKKAKAAHLAAQPMYDFFNSMGWMFPKPGDRPWRKRKKTK